MFDRSTAVALILFGVLPGASVAQTQIEPKVLPSSGMNDGSRAESLRARMQEQQRLVEEHGREISSLVGKLKELSQATVESRVAEMKGLRAALVGLGTQLQPDAPLAQSIDSFSSWVSAQQARVSSARSTLGQEFAEGLLGRYRGYLESVSRAREALGNHSTAVDRALGELTTAELRAGEMLMAEDAGAAAAELNGVLEKIGKTVEDIRQNLRRAWGNAGV